MIIEATHLYLEGDQSKFKRNFHFRIVRRVFCFQIFCSVHAVWPDGFVIFSSFVHLRNLKFGTIKTFALPN